jgi:hypothetical protein
MSGEPYENLKPKCIVIPVFLTLFFCIFYLMSLNLSAVLAQATQQQEEKKETVEDVPKAPNDDFTVQVYKALDEKKADKLTFKDKYKVDKSNEDVEIIVTYYNWSVSPEDFWNRQITIDTKTKEGIVVEKIQKSGFGDLGYVKSGDKKTLDSFKKEKITVTGQVAVATMVDMQIGKDENDRYHGLMAKFILKK